MGEKKIFVGFCLEMSDTSQNFLAEDILLISALLFLYPKERKEMEFMKQNMQIKILATVLLLIVMLSGCELVKVTPLDSDQGGNSSELCETCSFGEWEKILEATCKQQGALTRTCTVCGNIQTSPVSKIECKFGEWTTVTEPTVDAVGLKKRVCTVCGEKQTEELAKLVINHAITCDLGNKSVVVTAEDDGSYTLADPTRVGYDFLGWKTEAGVDFAKSGVIEESLKIVAQWSVTPTTTFVQLKSRIEGGAKDVHLAADIVLTETIYVTGVTTVSSTGAYALTRSPSFNGDLFVLGENAEGEDSISITGNNAALTFLVDGEEASLTLDGNKANMTVDVMGTVFFLSNSSTVSLYEGVTVTNCKKVGNIRMLDVDDDLLSNLERVGGAAAIIVDGTLNLLGATISECEVNLTDKKTVEIEGKTEEVYNDSSCGGAIFNRSTVNMSSGTLKNNKASRGAAIFNYRTCNLKGGLIDGNYAETYGAALYMTDSQYTEAFVGEDGAESIKLKISNNSSKKSGGAIFGQHQSSLLIYGGVEFNSNKSLTSNGGAINMAGALTIKGGNFVGNLAASKGGALYVYYSDADQTLREVNIDAGYFEGNEAAKGGAVGVGASSSSMKSGAKVKIGSAVFRKNRAFLTEAEDPSFIDNTDREGVTKTKNGSGGAFYVFYKASVEVYGDALFEENHSEGKGGAIYLTTAGSLVNLNATEENYPVFSKNTAGGNGGAIYVNDAELKANYASFTENKSADSSYGGGALYFTGGKGTLSNVTFENNASTVKNGGAICAYSESNVELENAIFRGNSAANNGGAIYVNKSELKVNGATFTENESSGVEYGGGALYFTGSKGTLSEVTFENNSSNSMNGGAICAYSNSTLEIEVATFNGNTAKESGGAVCLNKSEMTATTLLFSGNVATSNGGAIYSKNSTITVDTMTCENNTAKSGGAVYTVADGITTKMTVEQMTLRGNSASGNGGALYLYTDSQNEIGTLIAVGNTSAGNYGGGVIYASGASTLKITSVNATNNEATNKGGFLYETTTGTTVTILGGSASDNIASAGGTTIFVNSKKSVLNLPATGFNYPEGSVEGVDGFAITVLPVEAAA